MDIAHLMRVTQYLRVPADDLHPELVTLPEDQRSRFVRTQTLLRLMYAFRRIGVTLNVYDTDSQRTDKKLAREIVNLIMLLMQFANAANISPDLLEKSLREWIAEHSK